MSWSEKKLTNPAEKFITFKAEEGKFVYWDKEQEKNIEIGLPIHFVVLDELTTIRGYHSGSNSYFYSNEIKYQDEEILNVKTFKGNLNFTGKYKDIRDSIKANGGKYAKSIYAIWLKEKDNYELINFNFSGSTNSAWINKSINVEEFGIVIKKIKEEQGKKDIYYVPVFSALNVPDYLDQIATEMDKKLQDYLRSYRNQKVEEIEKESQSNDYNDQMQEYEQRDQKITTEEATKILYPEISKSQDEENLNPTDDLPF
jgi:hypothetical protein